MSPKLPVVNARQLARVAQKLGFESGRQRGSHAIYYRERDRARVVIPVHGGRDLDPTVVAGILRDMGIDVEEFRSLL